MIKVVCQNSVGEKITLEEGRPPYYLQSVEGVREIKHIIQSSQSAGQDGVTPTGSSAEPRNILLTLQIIDNHQSVRDRLGDFFQPEEDSTLYYYEGRTARKIQYRVESLCAPEHGAVRRVTISLLCGDPRFYDIAETRVSLASWVGLIEWPLEIIDPFEVTVKVSTLMQSIYNPAAAELGLRIIFRASGEVTGPKVVDVDRHAVLQIAETLHAGDWVEITTGRNHKRAVLHKADGQTQNVINSIAYPPQWITLKRGDNLIRYDADSGINALSVELYYSRIYWGV